MMSSKDGGFPLPHGLTVAADPVAAPPESLSDFASVTRVTPWTLRIRDISAATAGWLFVQPLSSIAGALTAPRSAEPPVPPPPTLPLSVER